MTAPVLELRDVTVTLPTDRGPLRPVDGVSFAVEPGRTLAVVGESGCGKSVTALSVMGLLPQGARIGGSIRFDGRELTTLDAEDWRLKRGREMAMIFQEPMTSLNPAFRAGEQVAEALRLHQGLSPRAALDRAIEMLDHVRIPDAARRAMQYPHQLSGGMRQRVMIAMALACRPRLLIADEPTTALDVTVQAQILALIDELKAETGTAVVLITHDLGVVARQADRVAVMYAGRVIETGTVREVFAAPRHPYTISLLRSIPDIEAPAGTKLAAIAGSPPDPARRPAGCAFAPRCFAATEQAGCRVERPVLRGEGHLAACHRQGEAGVAA
jgi:oligopeptide/dipeptide ABC transporter ATP-binding protein